MHSLYHLENLWVFKWVGLMLSLKAQIDYILHSMEVTCYILPVSCAYNLPFLPARFNSDCSTSQPVFPKGRC